MENFIEFWKIIKIGIIALIIIIVSVTIINVILKRKLRYEQAKLWLLRKMVTEKPAKTIYPDEIVSNMSLKAMQETVTDLIDYYRQAATKWNTFILGCYLINIDSLTKKKEQQLFEIIFGQAILSLLPNRLATIVVDSIVEDMNQRIIGVENVNKKRAEDFILRMMLIEGKEGNIAYNFLSEFDNIISYWKDEKNINPKKEVIIELAGKFRKNFE